MATVCLKIDVSGTTGDEAFRAMEHYDQIESASFGPAFGCGSFKGADVTTRANCEHADDVPHPQGEWIGAEIRLQTPLLAQYAVSHYLEQDRVIDADLVE